mmetsp:Transcript_7302/g.18254  ORF Transcript_7302/g.18254 Transcript_7302/m.18254 type:complete len:213 (+) Transcript_7302:103-741(+)
MVIPMPAIQMPDGPPPAACDENMKRLKWSVVAMIVFGLGRMVFAFLMGALNADLWALVSLFISIVMGTFMFKDDEHLKSFYDCLAKTICQICAEQGQGGLQCLVPFMMCTMINAVFDLVARYVYFGLMPYGFFLMGSLVSQFAAVFFAWLVFKVLRGEPQSNLEMGAWGRPGGNDAPSQQAYEDGRHESSSAPTGVGTGFTPFGGAGNRLGS